MCAGSVNAIAVIVLDSSKVLNHQTFANFERRLRWKNSFEGRLEDGSVPQGTEVDEHTLDIVRQNSKNKYKVLRERGSTI